MEAQQFWHVSLTSFWIFTFLNPSLLSGSELPKIELESTVFVAFKDSNLNINVNITLEVPNNHSNANFTCFDPDKTPIYHCDIYPTSEVHFTMELKNLTRSGEYSCWCNGSTVYWFLRVRDCGYKPGKDTEQIIFGVIIAVLLVFSVVGSVFVFRGYWKKTPTGDTSSKRKQNREERTEREAEQDHVNAITAPSTSFYASLETRPRSIYDVLDRPAAKAESDKTKAKPKKKEPKKTVAKTTQPQPEDPSECVYENF